MIWYKEQNDSDIVVSTRIRLARNLSKYPFPNVMNSETAKKAREEIEAAIMKSNSVLSKEFSVIHMENTDAVEKQTLAEKHLISRDLLNKENSSVMINRDENMSIMLLEEDHIRMQVIMGGLKLDEAYELASRVDDVIDENVQYAFDEEFGYLTACPTNTGTGLRASVMMHLPALTMTNSIQRIASSAGGLGIAVRGMYGEGSKGYGSLYQISNQVTLGLSENEIIEKVKNIVGQIEEREKQARKKLFEQNRVYLEDKLWRSYGTLKFARAMSSNEAKALISDVLMAKNMGIIENDGNLIELMIMAEPAYIEHMENKRLSPEERDRKRAELMRKML